ncbi:MAG: ABC transporter substrate-binding protein [Chloroflexi bacterium]|nr:ABC transporter substrate-binding protein [Chloroflexota bacterium]
MTNRSRRDFLRLIGLAAAGAGLAACGSAAAPAASSPAPASPSASAAAKPASAAPASAAAKPASAAAAGSAAAKPAASPATSGGPLPALKVAYVVTAATQSCLWMADAIGAFTKHGANVTLQFVDNNIAVKSLIAKELDVVMQSATAIINADLNGGADLVYVGSVSNHPQGELVVKPAIKTPADLKGKLIGSDKPGSTTDYYTQLEFKLMGINPSDVQVRAIGSGDIIIQALSSGQLDGGTMTPPQSFQAEAQGFQVMQTTFKEAYQGNGAMVSKARLDELKPALLGFLAGVRDGVVAFNSQPDMAKQIIAKYAKIEDPNVLDRTYQFHQTSNPFQPDLLPTLPGIQAMLDFLSTDLPAAKTAKPEQFVDLSLLQQLPPVPSGGAPSAAAKPAASAAGSAKPAASAKPSA